MKTKFRSIESGKLVTMWPTTDHPQSSYGMSVWVDKDNWCYGQCDLWPVPFGFIKIEKENINIRTGCQIQRLKPNAKSV